MKGRKRGGAGSARKTEQEGGRRERGGDAEGKREEERERARA